MNELELIKKLLNSKLESSTKYTPDQLDGLVTASNILLKINGNIRFLGQLNDSALECLKNLNIISLQEENYLRTYRYISCTYNDELKEESINNIKRIIGEVARRISELSNTIENKEIRDLVKVVDNNFYNITEKQLDLLFGLISESDLELGQKRDLFIYVSVNSIKYQDELLEEQEEEEEIIKGIFQEECIELFSKYGYDFNEFSEKNRNYIMSDGNYDRIDGILSVLKKYNIDLRNNLNHNIIKTKQNNICEIFVKSNKESVERIIKTWIENDFVEDGVALFYVMVEEPYKFIEEKREYRRRGRPEKPKKNTSGEESGRHHSYIKNIKFFTEICHRLYGEDINYLKLIYERGNASVLNYPHDKVLEVDRILKAYGLSEKDYFESATTVFMSMHHADVLDLAIELDVLDYIKNNQSRFSLPAERKRDIDDEKKADRRVFDLLYLASINRNIAFSSSNKTNFVGEIVPSFVLNQSLLSTKLASVEIPKGIDGIAYNKEIFKMFEERVESSDFDISAALKMLESDDINPIKVLDTCFKEDDYVYIINGIRISRNKVLRIYSALSGLDLDPKIGKYNMILYALTRNSYLTSDEIISLAVSYNKAEEEMKMKGRRP